MGQPIAPTFIWTQASTGEYTVNTGDHFFRFFCDGREYPTLPQHSLVCTEDDPHSMKMIYKVNGREVSHALRALSPDGEVLVVTATENGSTGPKVRTVSYQRTSASTGFVGAWTDKNQSDSRPPVLLMAETGSVLRLSFPGKKQHIDIPLNGTDALIQGITPGVHATLSAVGEETANCTPNKSWTAAWFGTAVDTRTGRTHHGSGDLATRKSFDKITARLSTAIDVLADSTKNGVTEMVRR